MPDQPPGNGNDGDVENPIAKMLDQAATVAETPITVAEIVATDDDLALDDRIWIRLSSMIDYFDPSRLWAEDPDVAAYLATRVFEWEVACRRSTNRSFCTTLSAYASRAPRRRSSRGSGPSGELSDGFEVRVRV